MTPAFTGEKRREPRESLTFEPAPSFLTLELSLT